MPNRRVSCQDDDEEEEEAASKCFVLHIHCGRQRARSALVPVGVEPRFNETFLINLQVSTAPNLQGTPFPAPLQGTQLLSVPGIQPAGHSFPGTHR